MLPLESVRPLRIFLGNIPVGMDDSFALGILGTAVKGRLMAPVNLPYQDLFGFVEGLVCGVAYYFCIDFC